MPGMKVGASILRSLSKAEICMPNMRSGVIEGCGEEGSRACWHISLFEGVG